jgi:prolipoprotein diacylglyceryltransferase
VRDTLAYSQIFSFFLSFCIVRIISGRAAYVLFFNMYFKGRSAFKMSFIVL